MKLLLHTVNYSKKNRFSLQQIAVLCLYNIQSENKLKKKDVLNESAVDNYRSAERNKNCQNRPKKWSTPKYLCIQCQIPSFLKPRQWMNGSPLLQITCKWLTSSTYVCKFRATLPPEKDLQTNKRSLVRFRNINASGSRIVADKLQHSTPKILLRRLLS